MRGGGEGRVGDGASPGFQMDGFEPEEDGGALPLDGFDWPHPRDVAVGAALGLVTAVTIFAFFSWLPLAVHAGVFGVIFAGVLLFGRRIACQG